MPARQSSAEFVYFFLILSPGSSVSIWFMQYKPRGDFIYDQKNVN